VRQVDHALRSAIFFRRVVGQLRQRLGGRNPNAHLKMQLPLHARLHRPAKGLQRLAKADAAQVEKSLIDAVHLHRWCHLLQRGHDPQAHIGIERIVRAENLHPVLAQRLFQLKKGGAHADAERFGLCAAGNNAAVVVGEHHDGNPL